MGAKDSTATRALLTSLKMRAFAGYLQIHAHTPNKQGVSAEQGVFGTLK